MTLLQALVVDIYTERSALHPATRKLANEVVHLAPNKAQNERLWKTRFTRCATGLRESSSSFH